MSATSVSALQKNTGAQAALIASQQQQPTNETAGAVLAAQAKALVEARYIAAWNRPRDIEIVRQSVLKECKRPGFARVARYIKPIGKDRNKWPTGPSIRFAEAAIRNMTNISIETITIYDDREKRIVRVTVTDFESNVPYSQDVTVQKAVERKFAKDDDVVLRSRTNSYGDKVHLIEATDDDILNKQNALISKALRTLGLRLIPGDIVDEAMSMCVSTQKDEDAKDPNTAKRIIIDGFGELGVTAAQLAEYLGHTLDNLNPKELQELRGLFSALRDGETTWREIMDAKPQPDPDPKAGKQPESKPSATAAAPDPAKPTTTEKTVTPSVASNASQDDGTDGKPTFNEVTRKLQQANTPEEIAACQSFADEVTNASHRRILTQMILSKLSTPIEAPDKGDQKPSTVSPPATDKAAVKRPNRSFE